MQIQFDNFLLLKPANVNDAIQKTEKKVGTISDIRSPILNQNIIDPKRFLYNKGHKK